MSISFLRDPSDRWVKKETTDLRACLDWRDLQDLKELKDRLVCNFYQILICQVQNNIFLFF